jgi:TPR repeat protein
MNIRWIAILSFATLCLLGPLTVRADYRGADQAAKVRDWAKVFQECQSDALSGEKHCQSHLGYLYKYGRGVEKNLPLSIEFLKKCAAQQQMYCEEMLGDSFRNGLGVRTDYAEALQLFRLSSSKGNPWAFNSLGEMYRSGQGVPKDPAMAAQFFRSGADLGNGSAQANLANLYRLGDGVEKNGDLAFQWAQKSAKQNFGAGWNTLGLLYRDGMGVRQDADLAIEAFKKAFDPSAQHRSLSAYVNLSYMYFAGKGVPIRLDEAAKWAQEGVKHKNRDSMVLLSAILSQSQQNIPANHARAFQLAQEAYDMGSGAAGENLGRYHRDGIGTSVDYVKSFRYFLEARDKGIPGASAELGRMYLEGLGVNKDPVLARGYLLEAKDKVEQLGPGNRKIVENYFSTQPVVATTQPAPSSAVPQVAITPAKPDNTQKILLERLEKMQKQLESLQATANTVQQTQLTQQAPIISARRKALVIGNDSYQHVSKLNNAKLDAAAIAQKLKLLGYTVSLHVDVNEKGFKQALRDFRGALEGGDEVLFYFAGHGVQLGSSNFLLPVDTKGDNEEQVKDEAVELQRVLDDLKAKNAKFALAIIDACRDNPFKQSGRAIGGRGLAPTTAATGQMIMFSAGAGQQALDKLGGNDPEKNGVFTRVLLKEMTKPGIPVDRVLRNVRNEVVRLSKSIGHEQTPALYDQAVGDFYFAVK